MNSKSTNVEITNALFIDASGILQIQKQMDRTPNSLSQAARTKVNNIEMTTLMQIVTGLDNTQMVDLMAGVAMEWLFMHTGCDEQDIYLLMANGLVIGWWKNNWHKRDRDMEGMIVYEFGKQLKHFQSQRHPPQECRRLAQLAILQKYTRLHKSVMNPQNYQYRHLEESYAKLW